jgi:hypothetical protein
MKKYWLAWVMMAGFLSPPATAAPPRIVLTEKLVRISAQLHKEESVLKTVALIERAAAAGYTGIVLVDNGWTIPGHVDTRYRANVFRVRSACDRVGVKCIVAVMGFSPVLWVNPNLSEGIPVQDAPFIVRDGSLVPLEEPDPIRNPGFESFSKGIPADWKLDCRSDRKVSLCEIGPKEGKRSLCISDSETAGQGSSFAEVRQSVAVQPWRSYRLSLWVRTENFYPSDALDVFVEGDRNVRLNYVYLKVENVQSWRQINIVFNSLEFSSVTLRIQCRNGPGGKILFDDVQLGPGGLVNLIRREGAPIHITSLDGGTTYMERKDFSNFYDPLMGSDPPGGGFTLWHEAPLPRISSGSRLREGQVVLVSYYHAALVFGCGTYCLCLPQVYAILDAQVRQAKSVINPDGYFMQHDEIRLQGWDESCHRSNASPGENLARNVRRCTEILRSVDPGRPLYIWSDMFEPYSNAAPQGRYYLVKGDGPWNGSWKGLDKDVIVVNWHGFSAGRQEAMRFFAEHGNRQILAGYYDGDPDFAIGPWLRESNGISGIIGVMYTTWKNDYGHLESFLKEAEAACK